MFRQYPHIITIEGVSPGNTQDANGNWTQTDAGEILLKCRYETKDGQGYLTTAGGEQVFYNGIVHMPLPVPPIPKGCAVKVYDKGVVIVTDSIKHFSKGQLHARIWI